MNDVEGRPLSDEIELMESARRGDMHAYDELVQRYEEIAFRTAYLLLGDADDARDAAQDGFIRAWQALSRFRPGADPRPWLLRIVANAARNRRRGAGRQTRATLRLAHDRHPGGAAPSPEVAVVGAESRDELLAAMNRLRDDDRVIIALRWFVDLPEGEMASVLAIPRGTVKSRLSRAMARLRAELIRGGSE